VLVALTHCILIGLQIAEWAAKVHRKLHIVHIYHIVIQLELKHLIAAKLLHLQKC
jgi:hypothetical protein